LATEETLSAVMYATVEFIETVELILVSFPREIEELVLCVRR